MVCVWLPFLGRLIALAQIAHRATIDKILTGVSPTDANGYDVVYVTILEVIATIATDATGGGFHFFDRGGVSVLLVFSNSPNLTERHALELLGFPTVGNLRPWLTRPVAALKPLYPYPST